MAPSVPVGVPDELPAGDTWQWDNAYPNYPIVDGWVITYAFRGVSVLAVGDVTVDPTTRRVTVAAVKTAPLTPGEYHWASYATLSGARYQIEHGTITVAPNFAALTAGQALTHAERMVALLEAAIEGRVPNDMQDYQISTPTGLQQITKIPVLELKQLRARYRTEVFAERNGGQLTVHRAVFCGRR